MSKQSILNYLKKHILILNILSLLSLFLILINLFWLALGIIALFILYKLLISVFNINSSYFILIPFMIMSAISLAILARLFIIEVYTVPSESMEDALFPGDYIIVSKLNYGPKLPQSVKEIPWINLVFTYKSDSLEYNANSYRRLNGISNIKKGDIVVFKRLENEKDFLVKRCIGIAGDTLQIIKGTILINNIVTNIPTVKQPYTLLFDDEPQFIKTTDSLNIKCIIKDKAAKKRQANVLLNSIQLKQLKGNKNVSKIQQIINDNWCFPWNDQINWTTDNFGPLLIPVTGRKIQLDKFNYALYQKVLSYENSSVSELSGIFYIDGIPKTQYTFKNNYYFMIGDNRSNSNDSRFFGFVPEQCIEGKAYSLLKNL